ncbi:MAG: EscU/YscU/HrcU family type III secretion system export apparatus switch protein [Eubacterium sp.]|jgi:flagellar biosynthesis protein|nr:EscU/YscU/HrcU family type III secretion system export apparatus switch protein [Eubacterium sp.]
MSQRKLPYGQKAAIALKYNPDTNFAPVVVASGLGEVARKIVNIADENGIPIYRDDSAAALLVMLNSGEHIPPALYSIVATIYAEVVYSSDEVRKSVESDKRKKLLNK